MEYMNIIKWSESTLSFWDLYNAYRNSFPVVVKTIGGYLGDNLQETVSTGEILRIHTWESYERVLVKDDKGRYFSIPLNYPVQFRAIKNGKETEKRALKKLIAGNTMPFDILMDDDIAKIKLTLSTEPRKMFHLGQLTVMSAFDEKYLKANVLREGTVFQNVVVLPTYLPAKVVVAQGLLSNNNADWKKLQNQWAKIADGLNYSKANPNIDINLFSASAVESCDKIYESLEPSHYVSLQLPEVNETTITPLFPDGPENNSLQDQYASLYPGTPPLGRRDPPGYDSVVNELGHRGAAAGVVGVGLVSSSPSSSPGPRRHRPDGEKPPIPPKGHKGMKPKAPAQRTPDPVYDTPPISPPGTIKRVIEIPDDISDLTVEEMCDCLRLLQMPQYISCFGEQQIDGEMLKNLEESHLIEDCGVKSLHARKLMMFAKSGYRPK